MFEPNSIRSLLKKRNMSKLSSQNTQSNEKSDRMSKTCTDFSGISKNNTDPDFEAVVQAKLMIKQIDHEVSNIRTWRQNQKQLLQQKLKNNEQLFNISKQEYQKYTDQKIHEQDMQNKKLIQKMKIQENRLKRNRENNSMLIDIGNSETLQSSEGGQPYENWQQGMYDPELMANITSGEEKINQKKYMKAENTQFQDNHQAFLNSISELSSSDIFTKKSKDLQHSSQISQQNTQPVDKNQLRKELDDIDKELRQMEELLKD